MANEFTRVSHASTGSTTVNINASKSTTGNIPGKLTLGCATDSPASYIPVSGYKHLSLNPPSTASVYTVTVYWAYADGTESQSLGTLTRGSWTDFTIPDNAICVKLTINYDSVSCIYVFYSLTN